MSAALSIRRSTCHRAERIATIPFVAVVAILLGPLPSLGTEKAFQDIFPTSSGAFSNTTATSIGPGEARQYNIEGYFDGLTNRFRCYHTDIFNPIVTGNDHLLPPPGVTWYQGPASIDAIDGGCCSGDQGWVDDSGFVCMALTNSSTRSIEACVNCAMPSNTVTRDIETTGTKISPRFVVTLDFVVAMPFDFIKDEACIYRRGFNETSWTDLGLCIPCNSPVSGRHGDLTADPSSNTVYPACYLGTGTVGLYSINVATGVINWNTTLGFAGPPGPNFEYIDAQHCPNLQSNLAYRFGNPSQGFQVVGMLFDVGTAVTPTLNTSVNVPIGAPGDVFGLSCHDHLSQVRIRGTSSETVTINSFFGDGTQGEPVTRIDTDSDHGVNFVNTYEPVGSTFTSDAPGSTDAGPTVVGPAWGRQPFAETYIGMNPRQEGDPEGVVTPEIRFGAAEVPIFFHDFETGDARYWSGSQGLQ